jgi:hypothetical protein
MTKTQIERLKADNGDYLKEFPDAVFAPWDPAPIGARVRKGDETGKVVGTDECDELPSRPHANCPSCSCPNPNTLFGWWKIESEQRRHGDGKPYVFLEYPPAWVPIP